MGEGALWRIPERKKVRAVFFDIDGTLTDAQGRIPGRTVSALKYMSGRLPLYLSTALPMAHAKKRLGDVFDLFSGGFFADGGFLCYEDTVECVPVEHPVTLDFPGCRITRYTWKGEIFKYAVLAPTVREATRLSAGLEGGISTVSGRPVADSGGQQGGKEEWTDDSMFEIGNLFAGDSGGR